MLVKRKLRMTEEQKAQALHWYYEGSFSAASIAKELGFSQWTILKHVLSHKPCKTADTAQTEAKPEATTPSKAPAKRAAKAFRSPKAFDEDKSNAIYELLAKGHTDDDIAKLVGCATNTVFKWRTNGQFQGYLEHKAKKGLPKGNAGPVTDEMRKRVLAMRKIQYYDAGTISAHTGLDIGDVMEVLRDADIEKHLTKKESK